MKILSTALAVICSAGLTACHGASSPYAPQTGDAPAALHRSSSPAQLDRAIRAATKDCNASPVVVPGRYVGLFAVGIVSGGAFTSVVGQWSLTAYSKSAAALVPAAKPTPIPSVLYSGTYTMTKTKKTGCVLIVAGQAVPSRASNAPVNAEAFGTPLVTAKSYGVKVVELGLLSMKLTGLNGPKGRGTATLTTTKFAPYDTATIVLTKRTSVATP